MLLNFSGRRKIRTIRVDAEFEDIMKATMPGLSNPERSRTVAEILKAMDRGNIVSKNSNWRRRRR